MISVAVNAASVEAQATSKSHAICASHSIFKASLTVKFPVIVTSHKYQANAEKSPVISVPLDNTNV